MNRRGVVSVLLLAGLIALGGCVRLRRAADGVRDNAESEARLARANRLRWELIMRQQARPNDNKNALLLGERFVMRAEGGGWSVIDLEKNAPISIAGRKIEHVDQESARKALDNLETVINRRGLK